MKNYRKNKRGWFIYDQEGNRLRPEYFASEGKARAFVRIMFALNQPENMLKSDEAFVYKKELVN